ncbi:hypothetical protein ACFX2I_013055 [Malus domestica]
MAVALTECDGLGVMTPKQHRGFLGSKGAVVLWLRSRLATAATLAAGLARWWLPARNLAAQNCGSSGFKTSIYQI